MRKMKKDGFNSEVQLNSSLLHERRRREIRELGAKRAAPGTVRLCVEL
jgi:hypothetical protein